MNIQLRTNKMSENLRVAYCRMSKIKAVEFDLQYPSTNLLLQVERKSSSSIAAQCSDTRTGIYF